jgi:voltage-gated potassium channel
VANLGWDLFILALALLSLVNLVLVLLIRSDAVQQVVVIVEVGAALVFVVDFVARVLRAGDRRAYMIQGLGWLHLLSCVPLVRWVRIGYVPTVARRIDEAGGTQANTRRLLRARASTTLLAVVLLTILVLEFGSMAILAVEQNAPGSNIVTAVDALWFVIVSISTVGYGDLFPTTNLGRLIGTVVLVTGIALFSTLTGFLAHFFFGRAEPPRGADDGSGRSDEEPAGDG